MFRFLKSTIFVLLFSLFFTASVQAQGIPGINNPVSILMIPENPRPNEVVYLEVTSSNIDVNSLPITWTVDNKIITKGTGAKSIQVVAGKLGDVKNVRVSVVSKSDGTLTTSALIRPSDIALLWQAYTYTPPFYRGKVLSSIDGSYKITAIPEMTDVRGKKLDPKTLVYIWKKNDVTEKNASGYGQNTFTSSHTSLIRTGDEIEVEITSPNDDFTAKSTIEIIPIPSEIHVYEKNPLYGTIYEKELGDRFTLANEEVTFGIEPYFFSAVNKSGYPLTYTWTLNNEEVADFKDKNALTLRKVISGAGRSELSILTESASRILQSASKTIIINHE